MAPEPKSLNIAQDGPTKHPASSGNAAAVRAPLILGIESSCDETAAAIVRGGGELLSSVVASQIASHTDYGGVVPELAAREHLRNISPVVRAALREAQVTFADLDAIAVTQGPGLAGALLVGVTYAKALGFALGKPVIAINHLEGHIHAILLDLHKQRAKDQTALPKDAPAGTIAFPLLALVVSGGHTHLYLAHEVAGGWAYTNVGRTRDDAAGEAFDKVAKLLGFGYPGGPVLDALAPHGDPDAVRFGAVQLKGAQRQRSKKQHARDAELPVFDFSYSGMKTAVLRHVELHNMSAEIAQRVASLKQIAKPALDDYLRVTPKSTLDLIASFQRAIVRDLVAKTMQAAREFNAATLFVTGGVAANSELRSAFEHSASMEGVRVHFPSRRMSTDNAAMIAAAAYPKFFTNDYAEEDFSAESGLALK